MPIARREGVLEFARATMRDVSAYAPDRAACRVDLSDNTNAFGAPPSALQLLRSPAEDWVTRYPTSYSQELRKLIASYIGVDAACIVTGCGSDDVLDATIRATCEPDDLLVMPAPSFPMIPVFARINGLRVKELALPHSCEVDAAAMVAAGGAVTYICSPNNPTGSLVARANIDAVIRGASGIVVLDEAYAEFASQSYAQQAPTLGNVVVVRTLSKAFGLAGLRIGFAVTSPALVREIEKARGPYKVSSLAEHAAAAAFSHDLGWVAEKAGEAVANRDRFISELRGRGYSPLPSDANFVFLPVSDSRSVAARMLEQGVAIRSFTGLPTFGDALRISIGPWHMMLDVLNALDVSTA